MNVITSRIELGPYVIIRNTVWFHAWKRMELFQSNDLWVELHGSFMNLDSDN